MQRSTSTTTTSANRSIQAIDVPLAPSVLPRIYPAVASALHDGPALLPLPSHPEPVRSNLLAALKPEEPLEDPDVSLVVPTSGSTGEPKGVMLSASAIRASATATLNRLGGPGRWLLALPATHVAGLMVLARSVVSGTEPVALDMSDGFDPELFAAASVRLFGSSPQRRYTALVPRQLAVLLDGGEAAVAALAGYDAVLVGGSAIDDDLLERARSAGVHVVTTYGATETCGGCVYDGIPLEGVDVDILDDGRIRLGGPMLASGYRLLPQLSRDTFAEGWFTTADIGHFQPDGRLEVVGRIDDVAVSGGVNVPLAAVDQLITAHPAVYDALAVALPDPEWGQRVVAAVIPQDPGNPPRLESVRTHVTRQAPAAYAPRELAVVDSLPHLSSGKPDRRALTELLRSEGTDAGVAGEA
ncbi:AMP-dependent synthetase [Actinobacteria bacterium YIM 96077]|uniref:AMP-dependent synthetase n=1 Tax=Phytoactinopolyspora halophila TaxID=1981511 RepID=A0A329QMB4_9ACTN|nr:o-succinylbenzoate--CoA ligase [Phytoactinopolyspora halophila]AYY14797.1 AMP-dependent synthetase [Actinobacteria bacterium YIM 96077]RAW13071.1 AMP-dependent synthetase [Phytoactinopolyspora halophila]